MQISIITASYNCKDFIKETIESVLAQTYQDWELIIVDDGSKDNSIEIINEYCQKDNRIKLFTHKNNVNKGLAQTVQMGLEKAQNEWVAFLECDDIFEPTALEEKIKITYEYPSINLIFSDVNMFGDEEIIENYSGHFAKSHKILKEKPFPRNIQGYLIKRNLIPTFSVVMVKKNVIQNCDFNSPIPPFLDVFLWIQITEQDVYYIDKKLTKWRMHKQSYINTFPEALVDKKNSKFQLKLAFMRTKNKSLAKKAFVYLSYLLEYFNYKRKCIIKIHFKQRTVYLFGRKYEF